MAQDLVSSTGSTMHRSVHLSRRKKGERAYWQGKAFLNRLAPVLRILHPCSFVHNGEKQDESWWSAQCSDFKKCR